MNVLSGTVGQIFFENERNWRKFSLQGKKDNGEGFNIIATGVSLALEVGDSIEVTGEFDFNEKYGTSFKATLIRHIVPTDVDDYATYLMRQINGIGPVNAKKLVKAFGKDTFNIMCDSPEKVAKIPGITAKKAEDFSMQMREKTMSRNDQMFYISLGIKDVLAEKIRDTYGADAKEILMENPYKLIKDLKGIGFLTADAIARKAGIKADAPCRIRAGIEYAMEILSNAKSHSWVFKKELFAEAYKVLKIKHSLIDEQIQACIDEGTLYMDVSSKENRIYLTKYYDMEIRVAEKLAELADFAETFDDDMEDRIREIEEDKGVELDVTQREAVMKAIRNKVCVITGGPGTGKTTTLDILITYLLRYESDYEDDITLVSPTGKAAKRMTEQTGLPASTIHRLVLANAGTTDLDAFINNEAGADALNMNRVHGDGYVQADTIICDETSMISLPLMDMLLTIIGKGTRLVMVGDVDQLPPVGVGQVLKDIINCGRIAVAKLTKIYRQAADSNIIKNAHSINNGNAIDFFGKHKDFFMTMYCLDKFPVEVLENKIIAMIKRLASDVFPRNLNISPYDVQILCPMRKGTLGVANLNKVMQEFLNPKTISKEEVTVSEITYREGDKVIHIKNDYNIEWRSVKLKSNNEPEEEGMGIFNGEVGIIRKIDSDIQQIEILYDDHIAYYDFDNIKEVELAYAMTVHKSQGSEYPAVIMPLLTKGLNTLYNRNLIYTGVTRGKDCVGLLGDPNTVKYMCDNTCMEERHSSLSERIRELIP